jgi:MFS superfamily sulfate permease-like transporter
MGYGLLQGRGSSMNESQAVEIAESVARVHHSIWMEFGTFEWAVLLIAVGAMVAIVVTRKRWDRWRHALAALLPVLAGVSFSCLHYLEIGRILTQIGMFNPYATTLGMLWSLLPATIGGFASTILLTVTLFMPNPRECVGNKAVD